MSIEPEKILHVLDKEGVIENTSTVFPDIPSLVIQGMFPACLV